MWISSVAVVGQGRPSFGDTHDQFFCRNGAHVKTRLNPSENTSTHTQKDTKTYMYLCGISMANCTIVPSQ